MISLKQELGAFITWQLHRLNETLSISSVGSEAHLSLHKVNHTGSRGSPIPLYGFNHSRYLALSSSKTN